MHPVSSASAAFRAALLLLALAPAAARGQSISGVAPGTRVRIELGEAARSRFGHAGAQRVIGMVAGTNGDTLLLAVRPGATIPLSRSVMRDAWVSGGYPHRWQSALRGAVMPALLGAAMSAAASGIHRRASDPTTTQVALSSAAWGAASGAVLGAWSPKERWRRVPLAPLASLASLASR